MNAPKRIGRGPAWLAGTGALVMLGMLVYGFSQGYFLAEGGAIASITWGQVLLVDIYVGLALFSGWIVWREARRPLAAAAWIAALLLVGNLVACLYVWHAWRRCGGDVDVFWRGEPA